MPDVSDREQVVKVVIFGEEYPIRGCADKEHILRVADYVDKKMREVALRSRNKSPKRISVLTALNLAGELFDLKDESQSDLAKVENKTKNFLELLDSALTDTEEK